MIIEKDATFQRLLDDDFCTKISPCIIITVFFCVCFWSECCLLSERAVLVICLLNHCVCVNQGKGVPDVNSRLMVKRLWDELHIPIFALVDADPHGIIHLLECLSCQTYFAFSHTFNSISDPHTDTHTAGLHVSLSQQKLAPVHCVMVPSLAIIPVGVMSSRGSLLGFHQPPYH